jgi:hypothetical protein
LENFLFSAILLIIFQKRSLCRGHSPNLLFPAFWQNFLPEKKMVQQHNARSCFGRHVWANPKKNKNKNSKETENKYKLGTINIFKKRRKTLVSFVNIERRIKAWH